MKAGPATVIQGGPSLLLTHPTQSVAVMLKPASSSGTKVDANADGAKSSEAE